MSQPPARLGEIPIPILDVKWQRALKTDYILFYSAKDGEKAGLYYAQIDFKQAGKKEPEKLLNLIRDNMEQIEDLKKPKELQIWDVAGNDRVLAVAYSVLEAQNKTTSKLMVLTTQGGNFVECDNVDHSGCDVNAIKVIVPFPEDDTAHVIYGLSKGMDASGH